MFKRALSVLLSLVIAAAVFVSAATTASAYTIPDEEGFAAKLKSLKSQFPNGGYYSGTYYENGVAKAWQCFGYALECFQQVFGIQYYNSGFYKKRDYTMGTIYAGDIVRTGNDSHSIFITKVDGDKIYFTDANYWSEKYGPNHVRWNACLTYSELKSAFTYKVHVPGNYLRGMPVSYANMDVNFYVDGKAADNIDGIGTVQVYVDGKLQKNKKDATSYTDFWQDVIVGRPYEVKVNITDPDHRLGGVDTYDSKYGLTGTTGSGGTKVRLVIVKDSGGLTSIPDGDYQIVSAVDNSYGVGIAGDKVPVASDTNVELQPVGSTPREQDCFTLTNLGNGYYSVRQMGTDMAVDVNGGYKDRYTNVHMYESNGTKAQQWKIGYDEAAGGYTLQSKCSGMYLTVKSGSMTAGANIYVNIKNNTLPKAQGWNLIPVGSPAQPVEPPTSPAEKIALGDADGSGKVNVYDASYVQKGVTGTSGYPDYKKLDDSDLTFRASDVDGSGAVNIFDAALILKYTTGDKTVERYGIGSIID